MGMGWQWARSFSQQDHLGQAALPRADRMGGRVTQIDQALRLMGTTVVDTHHHLLTGLHVAHTDLATERQRSVRSRQGVHVKALAAGGAPAMESFAIPGRTALGQHHVCIRSGRSGGRWRGFFGGRFGTCPFNGRHAGDGYHGGRQRVPGVGDDLLGAGLHRRWFLRTQGLQRIATAPHEPNRCHSQERPDSVGPGCCGGTWAGVSGHGRFSVNVWGQPGLPSAGDQSSCRRWMISSVATLWFMV